MTAVVIPIPPDIEAAGPLVVGFYEYLIEEKGNSPRMAEMLALRQAPRVMTDDVMLAGVGTLDQQLDPLSLQHVVRNAMRHGYKPKPTDFYCAAIAAFPGDPKAFLNHGQGRGQARRTLEERGWEGHGIVDTKGREPESDPWKDRRHKLHPRIVERIRKRKLKQNPELALKDQNEVRHEIVERHGHESSL